MERTKPKTDNRRHRSDARRERVSVCMSAEERAALQALAAKRGVSMLDVLRAGLVRELADA